MAARDPDVHFVRRFHDRDVRRDEPAAVRSAGGGNRIGRRLSHRIRLDEIRPLFPGRIHRHDHRQRDYRDALPRRLAFPVGDRWFSRLGLGPRQHLHLFLEGRCAAFLFYLGALDVAAFPLRPTDATRLGVLFRDCAREYFPNGDPARLFSRIKMAITVRRPKLNFRERIYLPAILGGMAITFRHLKNMLLGRTKVTMQYPEEKWDSHLPEHYRGAPALVKDDTGRVRCVACQLCEFICPPRAIKIIPGEFSPNDKFAKVEKFPREFDIDMIRCIYCGMCEEVCPEQAIYLRKDYAITGFTRADMVHHKEKLLEIGGVMHGVVLKWNEKK